jgi:UDP-N-acetylmuramoyl-L-alanyl-D-glutamate--2,6-diaminopimelate ligase
VGNTDSTSVKIRRITTDSREVETGDLFVAIRGVITDGHRFIQQAIDAGAGAIMAEEIPDHLTEHPCLFILVPNARYALGIAASTYYDHPSDKLKVVVVTGTNGKTSTTTLLWQLFSALGLPAGMIGTVENRIGEQRVASTHTTPHALHLNQLLHQMVEAGCSHVFMEASSHAIHQSRIAGVTFCLAIFTNLTHDHLDYHGSFAAYRDAKKLLFDHLPASAKALINADDKNGQFMVQNTRASVHTYGVRSSAQFKSKILENTLSGLYLQMDGTPVHTRLMGEFNASNLTAVYAAATLLQVEKTAALTALSNLTGAVGRFEWVRHPNKTTLGIVDYAHTPDALEKVLETIRQLKGKKARVLTVIGCGGDRDKAKRPLMAKVAAQYSDQLILTSDNPRTENPKVILNEMEAGLLEDDLKKTLTVEDREQAIKTAVLLAQDQDVILVAGKGHETYQEIKGVTYPFDDKAILQKYLENQ